MSELRKEPITGRWVIVTAEGGRRRRAPASVPSSEMSKEICPFCPGNEDKTPSEILVYPGNGGPSRWRLRVVPNKFPVLRIEAGLDKEGDGIYDRMNGMGAHEVIIETPNHTETLSKMAPEGMEDVLLSYRDRILDLRRDPRLEYFLIFKNYGPAAGAQLEHSHSQLIALPVIPKKVMEEVKGAGRYFRYRDRCIFCDIIRQEIQTVARVVEESSDYIAIAPYASLFPFEVWILPKKHEPCYETASYEQVRLLGRIFSVILKKLEQGLSNPAYTFVLHTSPVRLGASEFYHWHFEITPRIAWEAGFEWGSGFFINSVPPEEAARFLRDVEIP
jgi:UDPglucose--hexose-1-phosphate uridylyltransferase